MSELTASDFDGRNTDFEIPRLDMIPKSLLCSVSSSFLFAVDCP